MKQLLQTILLSLTLLLSVNSTVTAKHGGNDDDILITYQTSNDDIQVYPNPAVDYIMISDNETVTKVWIYNILGKRVKAYDVEIDMKYDLRDLPKGMYIVRLLDHDNNLILTRRINKINP